MNSIPGREPPSLETLSGPELPSFGTLSGSEPVSSLPAKCMRTFVIRSPSLVASSACDGYANTDVNAPLDAIHEKTYLVGPDKLLAIPGQRCFELISSHQQGIRNNLQLSSTPPVYQRVGRLSM